MSWYKSAVGKVKNYASSFWYDDYDTSFDYLEEYGSFKKTDLDAYKKTHNLYKLASVRRAISNFVQIVTNKSIPVSFATKSDSKTDGKKVILSADVDDNFDVSVGLALHEGSHIVLSDFEMLAVLANTKGGIESLHRGIRYQKQKAELEGAVDIYDEEFILKSINEYIDARCPKYSTLLKEIYTSNGKIGKYGNPTDEVHNVIQGLNNWIEDRRIDHYIYNSAPGYRDYYLSMYEHYFNDKSVTKGIKSDEFTEETLDSYMFRIINLLNSETNLSKLKGLRTIYRMLDLKNISRLKSSQDSLDLAINIVSEILKNVTENQQQNGAGKGSGNNTDGQPENGNADVNEMGDGDNDDMGGTNGGADVSGQNGSQSNQNGGDDAGKDMLSKNALQSLLKKFQKQKDFLNGNVKKKTITKQENEKLDDIQESGTELVRVGSDYENHRGDQIGKGVDCIVVKNLTSKLLESSDFPFTNSSWNSDKAVSTPYVDEVKRGTVLGTLLGKKLQIRSESRDTIFSRLKKGKIDGRMVASLGFDNDNVFYQRDVDQYKKANLHISIDYSGSMSGSKLRKAIVSTVAIVKACEMARNINTQVSVRSTDTGGRSLPYVALVHDSRKNTFKQFSYFMSALDCTNTTPEGLCFEAIMKELIPSTNDTDSYFLNFSDGQPTYNIHNGNDSINYGGRPAAKHTRKQVKKMQTNGLNILSYFITEYSSERFQQSTDWEIFKECYGPDAKYINVENMIEVAKTMNELFLKKER